MRPALRLIVALAVSAVACQRQSTPVAPSPSPAPAPAPGGPPASNLKIMLSCPSCTPYELNGGIEKGRLAQLKVVASGPGTTGETDVTSLAGFESSNPLFATVTQAGVLTPLDWGYTTITATYLTAKATMAFQIVTFPGRLYPDEVDGTIHERTAGDPEVPAIVDAIGAEYRSRSAPGAGSFFRFTGVAHAGFELVISRRGYQTQRIRVNTIPSRFEIALDLDPSLVRERLVVDRCGNGQDPPARVAFRSINAGFFRIVSRGYPYDSELKTMLDGQPVEYRYQGIDYELPVGNQTHELTLSCIGQPGSGSITYLRPR